jgi:hypothetical protein
VDYWFNQLGTNKPGGRKGGKQTFIFRLQPIDDIRGDLGMLANSDDRDGRRCRHSY